MAIVYRDQKGTELFPSEVDDNFRELDTRTAEGWRDMVCGLDTRAGATSPNLSLFRDGIYLFSFDPNNMMEVFATAHIDHDWKLGTMLYPHFHWSVGSSAIGTVRWGFEYTWAQRSDDSGNTVFGPTNTIFVEQTTSGVPYTHYVSQPAENMGVPGAGMNVDTVLLFRIFRDSVHINDTLDDVVFGITFDLHYECVRYATPNRDPDFFN